MYSGIIPPLVTPIDEQGNVCQQSVKNLIAYLRPHIQGIMPTLSSGEGWKLSQQQWLDMVLFSKQYAENLPVLAGLLAKTTQEVIARIQQIEKSDIDAVVISTPFQKDISQEEIREHYHKISEATNIPLFIYNEKELSGNEIEFDTLSKIFSLEGIVGIKESSGSQQLTQLLIAANYPVFQGWENLCYASRNCQGYILPLANLEPRLCWEMFDNPTEDKQDQIDSLCQDYELFSSTWFASVKKELFRRKIIVTERIIAESEA
jgi:4-hydroxy-tetrahydrodipicolinate synthase